MYRMACLALVAATACGSEDPAVGRDGPLDIGTISGEPFVAMAAIANVVTDDSMCKAGTVRIRITSQSSTCEMVDETDPRIEMTVPLREAKLVPSPDGECIEMGQDEFHANVEGESSGTNDVSAGEVRIDDISDDTIEGSFRFDALDDPQHSIELSGAFVATRCP